MVVISLLTGNLNSRYVLKFNDIHGMTSRRHNQRVTCLIKMPFIDHTEYIVCCLFIFLSMTDISAAVSLIVVKFCMMVHMSRACLLEAVPLRAQKWKFEASKKPFVVISLMFRDYPTRTTLPSSACLSMAVIIYTARL